MTAILETRGLTRLFGALVAVEHVSLSVAPGELRAIIGPNGAGKTTFFHLISGVTRPTSGQVLLSGEDVSALPMPVRCRRGLSRTFQIASIFPELTAIENVRLAIQLKGRGNFRLFGGGAFLDATERRAREALDYMLLGARGGVTASELAHGEQRLLEMAMALAQEPRVLLLDEPTQGLSKEETAATAEIIRRIVRERALTIVLVEHDMDVVFDLADRITVLQFGRVIAEGTPAAIRANIEVQKAYLGTGP